MKNSLNVTSFLKKQPHKKKKSFIFCYSQVVLNAFIQQYLTCPHFSCEAKPNSRNDEVIIWKKLVIGHFCWVLDLQCL